MRVFFQNLNNSQRYYLKNLVKIKQKRFLSTTLVTFIILIKSGTIVVVVFSRLTSVVFVVFKQIVVIAAISVYNFFLTCWHCNKLDHKKSNCFDLNQLVVTRVYELINKSNKKIKKIHEHVVESEKT